MITLPDGTYIKASAVVMIGFVGLGSGGGKKFCIYLQGGHTVTVYESNLKTGDLIDVVRSEIGDKVDGRLG